MIDNELKVRSIDDLFGNLDEDLRQENYSIWRKRVEYYLNSQFVEYNSIMGQTEGKLKRKIELNKFENLIYLRLGVSSKSQFSTKDNSERSRLTGSISLILFEQGSSVLEMAKGFLEKYIDDFRTSIKFDNLSGEDIQKICKVVSKDSKSIVYDYFTSNLNNYYNSLKVFLENLEKLNQLARELYNQSELYPGRFARRKAKDNWEIELQILLKSLEQQYSSVQSSYRSLREICLTYYGGVGALPFPTLIDNINELKGIQDELGAKDPKAEIKIEKPENKVYLISMEPIQESEESPKYKIDKASLRLIGKYETKLGKSESFDIDLTKGVIGTFYSNEVIYSSKGLVDKLQVKLTINLPHDDEFMLKSLKIVGSYELPYLTESKTLEKSLTTERVHLI